MPAPFGEHYFVQWKRLRRQHHYDMTGIRAIFVGQGMYPTAARPVRLKQQLGRIDLLPGRTFIFNRWASIPFAANDLAGTVSIKR